MRIFLFLVLISLVSGCTTIKVAKEVTKVSESLRASVDKMIKSDKKNQDKTSNNEINSQVNIDIKKEKEILAIEKKVEKKLVKEQSKIIEINFIGKTLNEVRLILGEYSLLREDGNTKLIRFDKKTCKLFLFYNSQIEIARAEHFEIRNNNGVLINTKEKIQTCYKEFKLN